MPPPARIQVFCRLQPTDKFHHAQISVQPDGTTINVSRPTGRGADDTINHSFTFDGVLQGTAASQASVYSAAAGSLVRDGLLCGISSTLLCYGQRGSGKSYTLFGGNDYNTRGIAPRTIHDLFQCIGTLVDERVFVVTMTFLELYGEQVVDLLAPSAASSISSSSFLSNAGGIKPNITLDGKGNVSLKNITQAPCDSEADALALMFAGLAQHRASHSARTAGGSHLVVSLYVHQRNLIDSDSEMRNACLHLVELAGTQRVDSITDATQRSQTQMVNRSLTMLEQVVIALSLNASGGSYGGSGEDGDRTGTRHVPYRQSKLTTLLKGCMGGRCLTTLIAHVCPEKPHIDATLSTLSFARRMMRVACDPVANITVDSEAQIRNLKQQVGDLKAELRLQSQLNTKNGGTTTTTTTTPTAASGAAAGATSGTTSGGARKVSTVTGGPPSTGGAAGGLGVDELQTVNEKVNAYIEGNNATLPIHDVREMHACFSALRSLVEQKDLRIAELKNEVTAVTANSVAHAVSLTSAQNAAVVAAAAVGGGAGAPGSPTSMSLPAGAVANAPGIGAAAVGRGGKADNMAGKRRSSRRLVGYSITQQGQGQNPQGVAPHGTEGGTYTHNRLDTSSGFGYGTSAKASNALPEGPSPMFMTVGSNAEFGHGVAAMYNQHLMASAANSAAPPAPTATEIVPRPPLGTSAASRPMASALALSAGSAAVGGGGAGVVLPPQSQQQQRPNTQGGRAASTPALPFSRPTSAAAGSFSTAAAAAFHFSQTLPAQNPSHGAVGGGSSGTSLEEMRRSAAFEDYKRTPAGALQVRALSQDQALLAAKHSQVQSLQQRLEGMQQALEQRRLTDRQASSINGGVSASNGHAVTPCPPSAKRNGTSESLSISGLPQVLSPTASHRQQQQQQLVHSPPRSAASPLATATAAYTPAALSDDAFGSSGEELPPPPPSGFTIGDLHRMSNGQATALYRSVEETLHRAMAERVAQVRQVERRRLALLSNFMEWHAAAALPLPLSTHRPSHVHYQQQHQRVLSATMGSASARVDSSSGAGSNMMPAVRAAQQRAQTARAASSAGYGGGARGVSGNSSGGPVRLRDATSYEVALLDVVEKNPAALQGVVAINGDRYLDAAERFEAMERQRQMVQDPGSIAYLAARKMATAHQRIRRASGSTPVVPVTASAQGHARNVPYR